jgi:hypothetical protein
MTTKREKPRVAGVPADVNDVDLQVETVSDLEPAGSDQIRGGPAGGGGGTKAGLVGDGTNNYIC